MQQSKIELNFIKNRFDFKKRTKSTLSIEKFDFERGLKSFNDSKLQFTNMSKNETEDVYNLVVDIYLNYLIGDGKFLDDFIVYDLIKGDRIDRLLDIISGAQKTKYKISDIPYILKMNNSVDKKLHFFIKQSRKNASLLLIDLYHLAVFGELYIDNKPQHISIPKIYRSNKRNLCKLEKILELKDS